MLDRTLTVIATGLVLAAVCIVVIAGMQVDVPSQRQVDPRSEDYSPADFGFYAVPVGQVELPEYLHIVYEDGRQLMLRAGAVAVVEYYPDAWGRAAGHHGEYLLFWSGPKSYRVDLATNQEGQELKEFIFDTWPSELVEMSDAEPGRPNGN